MKKIITNIILVLSLIAYLAPHFSFATDLQVGTNAATNLTTSSATLNGRVFDNDQTGLGSSTMYVRFKYSTSNAADVCQNITGTQTSIQTLSIDLSQSNSFAFHQDISSLQANQTYYFCAMMSTNANFTTSITYGSVKSFVAAVPVDTINLVITQSASSISSTGATLHGKITENNPNTVVHSRFKYSKNLGGDCATLPNATLTPDVVLSPGNTPNTYVMNQAVTGLTPKTKYFYCAMGATNASFSNPTYGTVLKFSTLEDVGASSSNSSTSSYIGEVTTKPIISALVTDTEATFQGSLTVNTSSDSSSSQQPLYGYFRYSEVENPPIFCNQIFGSDMHSVPSILPDETGLVAPGNFFAIAEDLEPDTQYAFCAVVSNHAKSPTEIKYGQPIVFHTLPCQDCEHTKIKTNPAEVLNATSAYIKGNYGSTKNTTTYFQYIEVDPSSFTTWVTTPKEQHAPGYQNIRAKLTGLKPNTQYNFKAIAETSNPDETFEGLVLNFRTPKYNGVGTIPTNNNGSTSTGGGSGGNTGGSGGNGGGSNGGGSNGGNPSCPPLWELVASICVDPNPPVCPPPSTGVYPDCVKDNGSSSSQDDTCPDGWTGIPPKCKDPNLPLCPAGTVGTYPQCTPILNDTGGDITPLPTLPTCESLGMTGTQPNCAIPAQSCNAFGMIGTFPDCKNPPVTFTCADFGMTGTYPNCTSNNTPPCVPGSIVISHTGNAGFCGPNGFPAPLPTPPPTDALCTTFGMTGTFPHCTTPVTSCQQMGLSGIWPSCVTVGPGTGDPWDDGNPGDDGPGNPWGPGNPGNPNGNGGGSPGGNGNGTPGGPGNSGTGGNPGGGNSGSGSGGPGNNGGGTAGCNNPSDVDCGGIPNGGDGDIDGDGVPNPIDSDTDGDGIPNTSDTDDDADGIPDLVDLSPTGIGTNTDYDGGGIPNYLDSDMDGDGIPNACDPDTDGDGVLNIHDADIDNDGVPNTIDPTPTGKSGGTCPVLGVSDTATPLFDDIVRYHEGIEHVFIRRIMKNSNIEKMYGYYSGYSLLSFAYDLAHSLAKSFGYVDGNGKEIRVSTPDVSAYALRISGNKLYVYEYYRNKIIDIRLIKNDQKVLKTPNPYEYFFKKKF